MTLSLVPCAICGGSLFDHVYPGTLNGGRHVEVAEYFGSSRTCAGHPPVVRCATCGLMMTNPQDDSGTLADVYKRSRDAEYEAEHENRLRAAKDHLLLVMRHLPYPGRILDVGCATGIFARVAQEAGWRATGVDASDWMTSVGRARCPQAAFITGALEEVQFPAESFDAITLWDVLEHVSSPSNVLRRVRTWLHSEGRLFLSVPNERSFLARAMGRRWVLLLREHLWYFCPATLARLLGESGLEVVEVRPKQVQFSVSTILARLGQYSGAGPAMMGRLRQARTLRRWNLRFPTGEMDVVARLRR